MSLSKKQREMIEQLKQLDREAKKAPWGFGGTLNKKGGFTTYRLKLPEEKLIITMRNHIGELIQIIEDLEKKG